MSFENSAHFKMKRKSKKRVFQCTGYDNCSMTFTRSEHLARHIRKHTGERPYQCQFCHKFFSRLDNLRQHKQTVHAYENGDDGSEVGSGVGMGDSTGGNIEDSNDRFGSAIGDRMGVTTGDRIGDRVGDRIGVTTGENENYSHRPISSSSSSAMSHPRYDVSSDLRCDTTSNNNPRFDMSNPRFSSPTTSDQSIHQFNSGPISSYNRPSPPPTSPPVSISNHPRQLPRQISNITSVHPSVHPSVHSSVQASITSPPAQSNPRQLIPPEKNYHPSELPSPTRSLYFSKPLHQSPSDYVSHSISPYHQPFVPSQPSSPSLSSFSSTSNFDSVRTTPISSAFSSQSSIRSSFSSSTSSVASAINGINGNNSGINGSGSGNSSKNGLPSVLSNQPPSKLSAYQQAQLASTGLLPSISEAEGYTNKRVSQASQGSWLRSVLNSDDHRMSVKSDFSIGSHFSVNSDSKLYLHTSNQHANRGSTSSFGSGHRLSDLMNRESHSARSSSGIKLPALSSLSLNSLNSEHGVNSEHGSARNSISSQSMSNNPLSKKPTIENMLAGSPTNDYFDFKQEEDSTSVKSVHTIQTEEAGDTVMSEPKSPGKSSNIGVSYYGHISQPKSPENLMEVDEIDVDRVAAEAEEEFSRRQNKYRNPNLPSSMEIQNQHNFAC